MSDDFLRRYTEERHVAVSDTECFRNFWSIGFLEVDGRQRTRSFERLVDKPLDREGVLKLLRQWRIVTFNGINYDIPMIALALAGASNELLKQASDEIILGGLRYWEFEERFGVSIPSFVDHIDVMEVSPGSPNKPSLKLYAGRMHSRRMQDLPIDPNVTLSPAQMDKLRKYHINDLEVTRDLYLELKPQIDLRSQMSQRYGVDVRSKSDAQVAEAVIKAEIQRRTGQRVYKPDATAGTFYYKPPSYIRFRTPELRGLLETIRQAPFVVDRGGKLHVPTVLEKGIIITIAGARYKVGYGGLHSQEKKSSHLSDDEYVLVDRDVTSYYPSIILGSGLYPKHLGPIFLEVYRDIYADRIEAKALAARLEKLIAEAEQKVSDLEQQIADIPKGTNTSELKRQLVKAKNDAETLKIVLNGSFGKFGSPFSILFSPDLMLQTTLSGQLAVLMLIEVVEGRDMHVASANTDGFVTRVPRARRDEFERLVAEWELNTVFMTEEVEYSALYSRDVNNYVAFSTKGKTKGKGIFTPAGRGLPGAAGMKKTPDREVVIDAVIACLKDGKPVERTIRGCTDIRRFVSVRRVVGGAEKDGAYLGKAVRWYWGVGETGAITYATNGNKVPKSDGAVPCMQLPEEFPDDIDYDWYIREAYATLQELGLDVVDPALTGRSGKVFARLPSQSTWHVVDLPSGEARCGRRPPSLRDPWLEVTAVPEGQRLCKTCRES